MPKSKNMYNVHAMKTLYTAKNIEVRLKSLAKDIVHDYIDRKPILIGILSGSFILLSDLSRMIWKENFHEFEVEFLGVTSYGAGKDSTRNPIFTKDLSIDIKNRHIILIEDIVETGYSLKKVYEALIKKEPASIKTLVLLDKKEKREVDFLPEYVGFTVPGNAWVEGYGLDTDQFGRGNPDIIVRE